MPIFSDTPEDALVHLAELLDHAPIKADIDDLAAMWEMTTIRITCTRPHGLEEYPEFSVRLRGAFGQAIKNQPAKTNWRGLASPLPHEVLFRGIGIDTNGNERQKPIVIRGWVERNSMIVEVRLFGLARWFTQAASSAMQSVLSEGISLGGSRPLRVPAEIHEVTVEETSFVELPERASSIVLALRSPFSVRHRSNLASDPRSILRAIPRRLSALAPWMALDLQPDDGCLQREIEEITMGTHELMPYSWVRHSKNRGHDPIHMAGYLGNLQLNGRMSALAKAIALAQHCNAGSHASLGLGWFDAAIYTV
ncbi:MAG: CRISPR system precrRNA processing endoribonuclease RAMP protein Cas6 [Rhizobium sp.]